MNPSGLQVLLYVYPFICTSRKLKDLGSQTRSSHCQGRILAQGVMESILIASLGEGRVWESSGIACVASTYSVHRTPSTGSTPWVHIALWRDMIVQFIVPQSRILFRCFSKIC